VASDAGFVQYVCEQAGLGDALTSRKMFGEYALYLDGKVVGLVCNNQLFVKATEAGETLLGQVAKYPPYPGAKPQYRMDGELDDPALLNRLLRATALALPPAKPKPAKRKPKSA
jgi:TfoX/Sxy family transcriptional regulator of competence genes